MRDQKELEQREVLLDVARHIIVRLNNAWFKQKLALTDIYRLSSDKEPEKPQMPERPAIKEVIETLGKKFDLNAN